MAARTLIYLFMSTVLLCSTLIAVPLAEGEVMGAGSPSANQTGKRVFKSACAGCHKWHGGGGGGYGGAALSLRSTGLDQEQVAEVVACGRPGTGMPHHDAEAYKQHPCYGMNKEEVGALMPPGPAKDLSEREIAKVAEYVITNVKGKGAPSLEECEEFWGPTSRICSTYRRQNTTDNTARKQAVEGGKETR